MLKRIRTEAPIYLSEHRKLVNNLRTMLQLEGLIAKHPDIMNSFGIVHLPDLLTHSGVRLESQFDLVLGIVSMQPRHRDKLAQLYDPTPEKRHELVSKIRETKNRLNSLYNSPISTFAEAELIRSEVTQLHITLSKLEFQLAELPDPSENGSLCSVFAHVDDSVLEAEGFITHSGVEVRAPYPYHLTTKSINLISRILAERDRVRGLLDRKEPVAKKDVDLIWHITRRQTIHCCLG